MFWACHGGFLRVVLGCSGVLSGPFRGWPGNQTDLDAAAEHPQGLHVYYMLSGGSLGKRGGGDSGEPGAY